MAKKNTNVNNRKEPVKEKKGEQTISPEAKKQAERKIRQEKLDALSQKFTSSFLCVPLLAVLCFGVICAVCYINGYKLFSDQFMVSGLFHCLYVGDFSIGLSSRLLVGSIISLFTDTVTVDAINIFARTFLFAAFAAQSVFAALVIRKAIAKKNIFMALLSVIFIVNPLTVCSYTLFYGVLDLYNFVVFVASVVLLVKGKSNLQFVVPVLSVIGLLIHNSYLLAFFPSVFVLSLYRVVSSEGKQQKKEAAVLGINSCVSVAGFLYLSVIAKNFLRMSANEMLEYVRAKSASDVFIYDDYLSYYLYDVYKGTQMADTATSLTELIKINRELIDIENHIQYLLFAAPVIIIFWAVNALLIKRSAGKDRLPFMAACLVPFALIPELILSSDAWRWIACTVLSLFFILFAYYLMKIPAFEKLTNDIKKIKTPWQITIIAVLLIYFVMCFVFEHRLYG